MYDFAFTCWYRLDSKALKEILQNWSQMLLFGSSRHLWNFWSHSKLEIVECKHYHFFFESFQGCPISQRKYREHYSLGSVCPYFQRACWSACFARWISWHHFLRWSFQIGLCERSIRVLLWLWNRSNSLNSTSFYILCRFI